MALRLQSGSFAIALEKVSFLLVRFLWTSKENEQMKGDRGTIEALLMERVLEIMRKE